MGQTSTEAKREVDETRAHLSQTLEAIQFRARRTLDPRSSPGLRAAIGIAAAGLVGAVVFLLIRRRNESTAKRLSRKLKLGDLRVRLTDMGDDARAWAAAQRRLSQADGKSSKADKAAKESIGRRLLVSAAEAALVALASGYAKRLVQGPAIPHDRAHPNGAVVSKKH